LKGKITGLRLGEVMAHVTVKVGQNTIESVITRQSAEEMVLKKGDPVTAIIKATEVMISKDAEKNAENPSETGAE
jgi:molybdopterin-binding protein